MLSGLSRHWCLQIQLDVFFPDKAQNFNIKPFLWVLNKNTSFEWQFSPVAWLYGTSVNLEPGQNQTIMHVQVGTESTFCVNLNWSCWITLAMDWVPDKTASLFKATLHNTCRRNYSKDNKKQVKTWINQVARTVLFFTISLMAQVKACFHFSEWSNLSVLNQIIKWIEKTDNIKISM